MKHTITHTCHHTQSYDLFGSRAERENKLTWLSHRLCADCYRAEQEALAAKLQAVQTGAEMVAYVMGDDALFLDPAVKVEMVKVLDYIIANLDKIPAAQRSEAMEEAISFQFRKIWGGNNIEVRRQAAAIVSYEWRLFAQRMVERFA